MYSAYCVLLFLILMVCSGEVFVRGIIQISNKIKLSSFALGATILTIGTAVPDLFFSINSACNNHFDLSVSALSGSVIVNILICTGFASLISGIQFDNKDENLKFNMKYHLLFFTIFTICIIYSKGKISSIFAFLLIASSLLFLLFNFQYREPDNKNQITLKNYNIYGSSAMIIVGIVGLYFCSSKLLSYLIDLSAKFDIPKIVISGVFISLGNSMPEIITCILASFKKRSRFILGNIVGSNILTFSFVIGCSVFMLKICTQDEVEAILPFLFLDLPFLLFSCFLFYIFFTIKKRFGKIIGLIFIFLYLLYILLKINII